MKLLSILIPSYKREAGLIRFLNCLATVKDLDQVDKILVQVDCPSNDLETALSTLPQKIQNILIVTTSEFRMGISAAKNKLISNCKSPYFLLTSDDFTLDEEAISILVAAIKSNKKNTYSFIGQVKWQQNLKVNTLMHWSTHEGSKANYSGLTPLVPLDWNNYYGWFVCTPTSLFQEATYDENYALPHHDDLDFSYQLKLKIGEAHKVLYLPDMIAYQNDSYNIYDWANYICQSSLARTYMLRKYENDSYLWHVLSGNLACNTSFFDAELTGSAIRLALDYENKKLHDKEVFGSQYELESLFSAYRHLTQFIRLHKIRECFSLMPLQDKDKKTTSTELLLDYKLLP